MSEPKFTKEQFEAVYDEIEAVWSFVPAQLHHAVGLILEARAQVAVECKLAKQLEEELEQVRTDNLDLKTRVQEQSTAAAELLTEANARITALEVENAKLRRDYRDMDGLLGFVSPRIAENERLRVAFEKMLQCTRSPEDTRGANLVLNFMLQVMEGKK